MKTHVILAASLLLAAAAAMPAQAPAPQPGDQTAPNTQSPPPPPRPHAWQGDRDGNRSNGQDFRGPDSFQDRGPMRGDDHFQFRGGMHHEMAGMHGIPGLGLPPGEFWKNPQLATRIGLTPEQVQRLSDLSLQNRLQAVQMRATLQEEQLRLQPLVSGPNFDQHKAEAQIDKIADSRAALEKAEARSELAIRAILTPDQLTKLHQRPMGPHGMGMGNSMGKGQGQPGE